jgi:perosamine synthetase
VPVRYDSRRIWLLPNPIFSNFLVTPKQYIYPLRYVLPLIAGGAEAKEAKFGRALDNYLGFAGQSVLLGRARTGIYLLVKSAVTATRRKVFLSPLTIPDVVNMVLFAGGEPHFFDNEPRSTNVDLPRLTAALDEETAAVLVTHYHVNQSNYVGLKSACAARGVALFEDCAISLGGSIEGNHVGTDSDGGVFSFSSFKFLNYFWGGAVTTRNAAIAAEVASWPRFASKDYADQIKRTLKYDLATRPGIFGCVTAPLLRRKQRQSTEAQALPQIRIESESLDATLTTRPSAGALSEWARKLPMVSRKLAHRRAIASIYHKHLRGAMVSGESSEACVEGSCFVNYPIWTGAEKRGDIYRSLLLEKYDVGLCLYPNAHEHEKFRHCPGESRNVSGLAAGSIFLPTHPRVTEDYADKLGRALAGRL